MKCVNCIRNIFINVEKWIYFCSNWVRNSLYLLLIEEKLQKKQNGFGENK